MSAYTPMKLGFPTVVAAVTDTTSQKTFGNSGVQFVNIWNSGTNPAFVNSGPTGITVVFPTTGAGQAGTIIPPGFTVTYTKNNPADTTLAVICGTGFTTTLYVQSGEGV